MVPVYGLRFSPDQSLLWFSGSDWSKNSKTGTGPKTLIFFLKKGPNHLDRRPDQILKLRFGLQFRPNYVTLPVQLAYADLHWYISQAL